MRAIKGDSNISFGMVPLLALTNALGLVLISASYYLSVLAYRYAIFEACFLAGLLTLVVPNLVRLLSPAPTRLERILMLCGLAGSCYFVQFMARPLYFAEFDEFLHWRTADDILRAHHLFSDNAMLPASPYYPGLEILTNAVTSLTGLNTFYGGNIVIAAARLLMVLALFLLYEHLTRSSRMASVAAMLYMANPHFLFFDAIYNYETLSLPLAMFVVYVLARYGVDKRNHNYVVYSAWIVLPAVIITHHMTSYVLDGLLLLWAGTAVFWPTQENTPWHLVAISSFAVALSVAYAVLFPGNPVWKYLSEYFGTAFNQVNQIMAGTTVARPLFASPVQAVAPFWDRVLMTGAFALITFGVPFGIFIRRKFYGNALAAALGIASLLYPSTQMFRFTSLGTEITERAAAFLFVPIAYVLVLLIAYIWSRYSYRYSFHTTAVVASVIIVMFLGGVLVGSGPQLEPAPSPYTVVADSRSIELEGIEDAKWSLTFLGQDNRLATDRINQMLMSTYGHQRIVTRLNDNADVSPIFYSRQFDPSCAALVQENRIHYLVVDTRLSTAFPVIGTYFENDRPASIINRAGLTKFSTVPQINRLFDSGNIVIYDTHIFVANASRDQRDR